MRNGVNQSKWVSFLQSKSTLLTKFLNPDTLIQKFDRLIIVKILSCSWETSKLDLKKIDQMKVGFFV